MKKFKLGDHLNIHSYKHDSKIHRSWDEATYLNEDEEYMIFGNYKTLVVESDGRTWHTKEPAIMFFSKENWFNIIGQIKKNGIYYYCNIASPFIIEENTIKYIDYDLDLRVFPDGSFKVLDRGEYKYHKKIMNYSDDLDLVITNAMKDLIEKYLSKEVMFTEKSNYEYEKIYNNIKKFEINSNF